MDAPAPLAAAVRMCAQQFYLDCSQEFGKMKRECWAGGSEKEDGGVGLKRKGRKWPALSGTGDSVSLVLHARSFFPRFVLLAPDDLWNTPPPTSWNVIGPSTIHPQRTKLKGSWSVRRLCLRYGSLGQHSTFGFLIFCSDDPE